ncbi:MAG: exodeoxyribonuclease VII large subunit [Myxococcales bacterium]
MSTRPKADQFDLFAAKVVQPEAVALVPELEPPPEPTLPAILTVSELTGQVKNLLEGGFPRVAVSGELSNCRRQSSGHLYFTLKDAGATLGAVIWRREASKLPFEVRDGIEVVCHGRLEVYPPHGKYQLIAERLEPLGAGALTLAFEQLKAKLEREGLFETGRKRPLPFLPRKIGVVTSPTGAALRDFLRVLHLRYPGLPVLVAPARVQGEGAAADVAAALDRLSARADVDVIVVTRGGGSMEDLWTFNEELVARAIVRSRVPVVSAIGHEIDFTIADFAADRRAPTPTGAAEVLSPVRRELEASLLLLVRRLRRGLESAVGSFRERLLRLRFGLGDPRLSLADRRLAAAELEERLQAALRGALDRRRAVLRKLRERIEGQNPRADLARRARQLSGLRSALEHGGRRALGLSARQVALAQLRGRLSGSARGLLQERRGRLQLSQASLQAISPQRVFERGYSLTRLARSGRIVQTSSEAPPGEEIEVVLGWKDDAGEGGEDLLRAVVKQRLP